MDFGLLFGELKTRSKKPLIDKEENCGLFVHLHASQRFLKKLISRINFGDLAHSKNPSIEGEESPIIALLAAKALCGIGSGESCSAKNFEFRPGGTNNGNFLPFWPNDSRGMAVFDFEIGVPTSEFFDVAVGVGLSGKKGLLNKIEVGL